MSLFGTSIPMVDSSPALPYLLRLRNNITYAGLTRKNRKAIHSLRRTLASTLLMDSTPLLTISNILGHSSPKTTTGYTKVNLPALRKCALSYGKWEASA
ncbi:MAG: tyrosine-type recombinase/integrase [Gemmiger formicilis]|uniref:tyrosine-type recombinase/integrase n=2 Tax=Gemmiger formicilis TaxID=745368 RepID=UPI0039A192FE